MDKIEALNYAKEYSKRVKERFEPSKVMMFGSYVNGTPNEDSDIDIAVIFDKFNGNRLKASSELWRMTYGVNTIIEPILLDISADQSGFAGEVLKYGVEI